MTALTPAPVRVKAKRQTATQRRLRVALEIVGPAAVLAGLLVALWLLFAVTS